MRDFTFDLYKKFLNKLILLGYEFMTFSAFIQMQDNNRKKIVIRHDVDKKIENALKVAKLENDLGIKSSFYFRYTKVVFKPEIIKRISYLGHEVGYHYEILSKIQGDMKKGIELFKKELSDFRKISDTKTICMHGSPLSKWDNRKLWEKYDYQD